MARGELMKKLLASYGRDDEFRAVAEQIILEEEQKNNRVLARTLRKTLDNAQAAPARSKALASAASEDRSKPTILVASPASCFTGITVATGNRSAPVA